MATAAAKSVAGCVIAWPNYTNSRLRSTVSETAEGVWRDLNVSTFRTCSSSRKVGAMLADGQTDEIGVATQKGDCQ